MNDSNAYSASGSLAVFNPMMTRVMFADTINISANPLGKDSNHHFMIKL